MRVKTNEIILVSLFAALMTVGAFIKIPFPFVSLTFQPFFCAFSGIILGSRLGLISQLIYAAAGLLGAPIFTLGGGPMYIFNPSFGYIIGFIAAASIIGKFSEHRKDFKFSSIFISIMFGLFVIYSIGVPYSYIMYKYYMSNTNITLLYIIINSVLFFLKDLVLYVLAALVLSRVLPILKNAGFLKHKHIL